MLKYPDDKLIDRIIDLEVRLKLLETKSKTEEPRYAEVSRPKVTIAEPQPIIIRQVEAADKTQEAPKPATVEPKPAETKSADPMKEVKAATASMLAKVIPTLGPLLIGVIAYFGKSLGG